MNSGWVKSHRQSIDNYVYRRDHTAWRVFSSLLWIVDHKTGEWSGGRHQLALLFALKDTTVYNALRRLEDRNMLTLSSNNKFTTIRICNWGQYQGNDDSRVDKSVDNKQTTTRQPNDTLTRTKELKNINTKVFRESDDSQPKDASKKLLTELIGLLKGSETTKLTPGRVQKLKSRLQLFQPEDLRRAARNIAANEFMMGDNPSNRKYATIDYLLRNNEIVDKWLNEKSDSAYVDLSKVEVPTS